MGHFRKTLFLSGCETFDGMDSRESKNLKQHVSLCVSSWVDDGDVYQISIQLHWQSLNASRLAEISPEFFWGDASGSFSALQRPCTPYRNWNQQPLHTDLKRPKMWPKVEIGSVKNTNFYSLSAFQGTKASHSRVIPPFV